MRYVKRNALQGRDEELSCGKATPPGYLLAKRSGQRSQLHETTKESGRPIREGACCLRRSPSTRMKLFRSW